MMNSVVEQRSFLGLERNCIIQNSRLTSLGGCDRQEEDSVFLTPISSPAYSSDGNTYTNELNYFSSSPNSMTHMEQHHLQSLSSSSGYMGPGSPEEFCGSPYSPPYDNSSPHSLACSNSPHGSPVSLPCTDNGPYTPYISPSNSIHDIPASSLPCSGMPPYSVDVSMPYPPPTSSAGIYSSVPPHHHWINGTMLPPFDSFPPNEPTFPIDDGAIPVNVIEQMPPMGGQAHQVMIYPSKGSPSASPDGEHHTWGVYVPHAQEMAPIPYQPIKPKRPIKKAQVKPPVQVNDEHIKDIPTSAQLWEFTLRVLKKPAYHYMINWENRKEGLFRFHDAPAFAALWGKHRNRPNMTYDKVARALRYYYKRDILNQVGGRLTYRFSKRLGKLYATDD